MSERKEMIPAGSPFLCRPEWKLLRKVRYEIQQIIKKTNARDMRKLLKGIIAHMDDVFDDWPEDPK